MSNGTSKKKASSGFHFVAGLGSGCTTAVLLQPADLLKTRVQQSQSATLSQALKQILDGPHPIRQLWRGTTPSVIRTGFGSALYFGMLNHMRQYASQLPDVTSIATSVTGKSRASSALPKLGNLANLTTGAMARVVAGLIMNPVTVLKVRYESSYYTYTSLASAAKDIVAKEGVRGFFAGFGATAVRDAPYAGLYVLIYEQAKTQLSTLSNVAQEMSADGIVALPSTSTAAPINFTSGVLAAVSATTLTNPFDAIKTRLQLMPGKYSNLWQAAGRMLREEGGRSMFDGLSLRIGRKALSSALAWTVYEELIRRADLQLV